MEKKYRQLSQDEAQLLFDLGNTRFEWLGWSERWYVCEVDMCVPKLCGDHVQFRIEV